MGVNFSDFGPVPLLASPLKGEEPVTLASPLKGEEPVTLALSLEGGGTGYASAPL
jgi:hypothetical protein